MPNPVNVSVIPVLHVQVLGGRGPAGVSAYASYVATTSDDPVLTEEQWSAAGTIGLTHVGNGVLSYDDNGTTRYLITSETNPFPV